MKGKGSSMILDSSVVDFGLQMQITWMVLLE